jgi:hypothetical protein
MIVSLLEGQILDAASAEIGSSGLDALAVEPMPACRTHSRVMVESPH